MSVALRLENGKRVGEIVGDVAVLPVSAKNYLAVGKGYSIDGKVFQTIDEAGAEFVEFYNTRSGKRFRIGREDFKKKARRFEFGFGPKLAAPLSCFETIEAPNQMAAALPSSSYMGGNA